MAKARKTPKINPLLVAVGFFIVLFGIVFSYYLGFNTGYEKAITKVASLTPTPSAVYPESLEFDNPDGSKTIKIEDYGISFLLPKGWEYSKSEINYFDGGYPSGSISLSSQEGSKTTRVQLIPNFQGGWCEGGDCTETDFKTAKGMVGKRYATLDNAYYHFPRLNNEFGNLFISAKGNLKSIEQIVNSVDFPFLQK